VFSGRSLLTLPEWRVSFQPVDQKLACRERCLAVWRRRRDKHDPLAGFEPTIAMDYQDRIKRPPMVRLCFDLRQLSLGHAGIMLKGQRGDPGTAAHITNQTDKTRDPAYPMIAGGEPFEFRTDIKILTLYPDHCISLR
jgi:hypothetical protein